MTITHPTRRGALQWLAAGTTSLALPAFAQWPDKPIKIIVTFPPGGSSDILARVMAEQLGKKLGQPVVVDNKPGAGGTIGGALVAAAPADGYTFMLSNTTPIALGPFTLEKQPYDPLQAFTHVAYLGSAPLVIMASKPSGIASYADLDARARKVGRLDFGSGGPGSIGHIHGELIRKITGANLVHVPYRGGAPMTTDLIANVIPVGIDVITAYVPFFKSGQLVPLAVTGSALAAHARGADGRGARPAQARARELLRAQRAGEAARRHGRQAQRCLQRGAGDARGAEEARRAGHRRQAREHGPLRELREGAGGRARPDGERRGHQALSWFSLPA
jgi:tripartite-type tricarboxylate transporter receptor subunit TctC